MNKVCTGVMLAAVMSLGVQHAYADEPVSKTADPASKYVSIPFADLGNIRNWKSNDSSELYVQSQNGQWYRITFWARCLELPFVTRIAFVSGTDGRLDKYSSILADGHQCWFRTFQPSEAPQGKDHRSDRDKDKG